MSSTKHAFVIDLCECKPVVREVIDLTTSPAAPLKRPKQEQAEVIDMAEEEDPSDSLVFFGRLRTVIVGIRYYDGEVNNHEMVQLVREPDNAYDRWAIRVDNVMGQKVGHLKREQVCHLSPLLDQGQLRVEGVVPSGKKNTYTMQVLLYCFGPESAKAAVERRLRMGGLQLENADPNAASIGGEIDMGAKIPISQLEANLERLFEELGTHKLTEMMDPHPDVLSPLYPHQKVALAWMIKRENSSSLPPFWQPRLNRGTLTYVNTLTNYISPNRPAPVRGGVLADDMGLGKTLTVISLIISNRPGVQPPTPYEDPSAEAGTSSDSRPKKKRKTDAPKARSAPAAVSLLAASQSKSNTKAAQMAAAEEPASKAPAADGPRGTLIVCPVSVISNWQAQFQEHTNGSMLVHVYHGADRRRNANFLSSQDVVITSYATLTQDEALKKVSWLRVVLDESHTVKNINTQQAQAVISLKAERRWAVTGTPIQNRVIDLLAILAYLKMEPLNDRGIFNRTLQRPIKAGDVRGLQSLQVLLGTMALRRTKDQRVNGRPIVNLPQKTIQIEMVDLEPQDRLKYDAWEQAAKEKIMKHIRSNTLLQNYVMVMEVILRLRQICDHASLCPDLDAADALLNNSSTGPAPAELIQRLAAVLASAESECAICLSDLTMPCITRCGHTYCRTCIEAVIDRTGPTCPLCRQPVQRRDLFDPPPEEDATQTDAAASQAAGSWGAKIKALVNHLRAAAQQSIQEGTPVKSVVFSQFTGMLNKVAGALTEAGLPYIRMDGSTPARQRAELLSSFASKEVGSPTIFLISLKAGGVGLNMTAACQVHLLDPWWNPAVEEQAMDRVHRLGQTRSVTVFRYIVGNSIEERMLELQERKRNLSKAAFERTANADQQRQMRIDDIKLLMHM